MLCSLPNPPMQGFALRSGVPGRLTSGLYNAVCHRALWSPVVRCSEAHTPASETVIPSPPAPVPKSAAPPTGHRNASILSPLPSSQNDWFGREIHNENSFNSPKFRSVGSRSEPSLPSIPGRFSKYSKPISKLYTSPRHLEDRKDKKAFRKPMGDVAAEPDPNLSLSGSDTVLKSQAQVPSRNQVPEWMENYQFSYSEKPAAPIIGFRQPPWSPFGPEDMVSRPWTGNAPLKPSKKKLPVFDSFNPPPLNKKGVKNVARPGPFPPGQGPKPGKTREEILGEPLTALEIEEVVNSVNKRSKQLNLGRDGLTHNMLDVLHNHWKRSVCCKIKCKGVPTVDMDNVARVIEEKSGGVIIRRTGGVVYVFRGRNYNYKDRPYIPIMLWKPPEPIYPRLIKIVPDGLTAEEAKRLRAKGRTVAPLCKLAKNGVYLNLVRNVKSQFRVDEVVRVDCEGMNPTDYKKIGAKLKELVPCILLSFEKEQIIMARKPLVTVENSQPLPDRKDITGVHVVDSRNPAGNSGFLITETDETVDREDEHDENLALMKNGNLEGSLLGMDNMNPQGTLLDIADDHFDEASVTNVDSEEAPSVPDVLTDDATSVTDAYNEDERTAMVMISENSGLGTDGCKSFKSVVTDKPLDITIPIMDRDTDELTDRMTGSHTAADDVVLAESAMSYNAVGLEEHSSVTDMDDAGLTEGSVLSDMHDKRHMEGSVLSDFDGMGLTDGCTAGDIDDGFVEASSVADVDDVDALWQKAIDDGMAVQLDTSTADPDVVFKKASELSEILGLSEEDSVEQKRTIVKNKPAQISKTSPFDRPSMGGLGLDELAKLLAP